MLRNSLFILISLFISIGIKAQDFNTYFTNQTLRIDYIFAGTSTQQFIYLDGLMAQEHWAGRRSRLSELPYLGNGQIEVHDAATGTLIYCNSFSSLFQEWQATAEAAKVARSFQNTFLVPMPKQAVDITLTLLDNYHKPTATFTHQVDPTDVLIRKQHNVYRAITLHKGGSYADCIDIAILPEGYTALNEATFIKDAKLAAQALLNHEPFKSNANKFNIVAVFVPSVDNSVSVPREAKWKSTAFASHFSTFYCDRYLTTQKIFAIHDALSGIDYEHIIVLANTKEYGGGGIYNHLTLTAAHHSFFKPVLVHEFGHAFGGLADEYAYGDDMLMYPLTVEPWEPNITTKVDFAQKWENKMGTKGYSLVEGAAYSPKGVFRSAPDCRMRTNECATFCNVCTDALVKLIKFYTEK